jgi:hypothetical protein
MHHVTNLICNAQHDKIETVREVPVEVIREKQVYVETPVEKVIEKVVYVDKAVPVEMRVEVPVEKIVEKIVERVASTPNPHVRETSLSQLPSKSLRF